MRYGIHRYKIKRRLKAGELLAWGAFWLLLGAAALIVVAIRVG
jgi:hypothetical protein